MQDYNTYSTVIEGWKRSKSYECYVADCRKSWPVWPKRAVDYEHHLDRLLKLTLTNEESGNIYYTLSNNLQDEEDITFFLATAGSNTGTGGKSHKNFLYYVALGLFIPMPGSSLL